MSQNSPKKREKKNRKETDIAGTWIMWIITKTINFAAAWHIVGTLNAALPFRQGKVSFNFCIHIFFFSFKKKLKKKNVDSDILKAPPLHMRNDHMFSNRGSTFDFCSDDGEAEKESGERLKVKGHGLWTLNVRVRRQRFDPSLAPTVCLYLLRRSLGDPTLFFTPLYENPHSWVSVSSAS